MDLGRAKTLGGCARPYDHLRAWPAVRATLVSETQKTALRRRANQWFMGCLIRLSGRLSQCLNGLQNWLRYLNSMGISKGTMVGSSAHISTSAQSVPRVAAPFLGERDLDRLLGRADLVSGTRRRVATRRLIDRTSASEFSKRSIASRARAFSENFINGPTSAPVGSSA